MEHAESWEDEEHSKWDHAESFEQGYAAGIAYEKEDKELRKWDTLPDVEGWYWFSGKYRQYGFEDGYWVETRRPQIQNIVSDGTVDGGEFSWSRETMIGIWIGPLPDPFQEAA